MNFLTLIEPFVQVSMLRRAPQDLPASTFLLAMVLLAYVVVGIAGFSLRYGLGQSMVLAIVDTLLMAGVVCAMLAATRATPRIPQTLTALAGATAVMSAISLPAHAWVFDALDNEALTGHHMFVSLLIAGWFITVVAHVLRHALSSTMFTGIIIALAYIWLSSAALEGLARLFNPPVT